MEMAGWGGGMRGEGREVSAREEMWLNKIVRVFRWELTSLPSLLLRYPNVS